MNEISENTGPDGQERRAANRVAMQAAILKRRAQTLASPPPEERHEEQIEIIEFTLAHERYALETRHVREVYSLRELTSLPCTPAFVLGVINVRGHIVAIIDLKQFFDLPQGGLTDSTKVILIGDDDGQMGIVVDAVDGVRHMPVSALQPPLPTLTGIRADYLRGVTGERVAVLNAAAIWADPRMVVNEDVT
jgi:purine-binding chemotaxis protein CheW